MTVRQEVPSDGVHHWNWHDPHAPCALRPVPRMSHVCSPESAQKEVPEETAPESCVLFVSVSVWRDGGKDEGSGFVSELPSRCSSTREVKEEIPEGMEPDREVEDRSLYGVG